MQALNAIVTYILSGWWWFVYHAGIRNELYHHTFGLNDAAHIVATNELVAERPYVSFTRCRKGYGKVSVRLVFSARQLYKVRFLWHYRSRGADENEYELAAVGETFGPISQAIIRIDVLASSQWSPPLREIVGYPINTVDRFE